MNNLNIPSIETDRLKFLPPTKEHLQDWANRIFADPDVIHYMPKREITPYERAERAFNIYMNLWADQPVGGWVLINKNDNQLIGSCEIEYLEETNEYELGYALSKTSWGKGFGTEAASAATRFGFEHANLERIIAVVVPENEASWKVLKKIGFGFEKNDIYYDIDIAYYAITKAQFKPDENTFKVNFSG